MRVMFTGKKVEGMEYGNVTRKQQINLSVRLNVSVTKPNVVKTGSDILIRHVVMFGSPVDTFYLLMRHVTQYQVTDDSDLSGLDAEEVKKIINDTCVPLATEKINESLKEVCVALGISPLILPPPGQNRNPQ